MWPWLEKIASACWDRVRRYTLTRRDEEDGGGSGSGSGADAVDDDLLWSRDLARHAAGEFSFAVVQANEVLEDHSQVETGAAATFVGVYDGHGGAEASRFISNHLSAHLVRIAQQSGTISEDVVRNAFSATEEGFLSLVRRTHLIKPSIASIGSCCLVGVIWRKTLYLANLGDSRAVVGCLTGANKIVAEQLTRDHNASLEEVRQELRSLHPDDSQIVVLKNGVWRIKGIIQVSRSIGDAYLKKKEFAIDPSITRFHLSEPLRRPVLTSEPSVCTRVLRSQDSFVIFASDGLWEHLTNQQAVEIVYNNPREGIARRLVKAALKEAARKREMRRGMLLRLNFQFVGLLSQEAPPAFQG
ncbi:probable protein phosphatase 2C 43 isoform X2 [Brachypodium distachyon]|uniref:probable protein phosphatase 2C 43 isoform X2 n=1 Tax=Brachypodium distachyon TaxID=15368 RepID=UPI0001C70226|nr:probable protein phosphatase 2C 43 isoform X2 [Brachypodium distachyon]|eukprot:XP_024311885.1 probable protein phosphatase 2C 43 isoform X2 [Brachypodium distachyon]